MNRATRAWRRVRRSKAKSWCLVYALREAEGMPIKYVGQTRILPANRLRFHIKAATERVQKRERLSPVQGWVHSLLLAGKEPVIEVLDGNGVWDVSEAAWIERLIAGGERLLNVSSVLPDRLQENESELAAYRCASEKPQFGRELWTDEAAA